MPYSKTIIKELPLNGKLVTGTDSVLIGNNFQTYRNLRYGEKSPEGVMGMTKINNTAMINEFKGLSGFHFKKSQPAESHVLLQAHSDLSGLNLIMHNGTAIPNQGNFDSAGLFAESTGKGLGVFSDAPNGQVAFCNGKDSTIWAGNEIRVARFINYKESDATIKYDFTELVENSDTAKVATLVNDTSNCYMYVGCTRLPDKIKLYIGTGNVSAATLLVDYWNGSTWVNLVITDNTSTAGATLNKTGFVNLTMTTSVPFYPRLINGVYLYWLRVRTSATLSTTTVYYCTVNYLFQNIRDLWDGEDRSNLSFQVYKNSTYNDYSLNVHEDTYDSLNESTFMSLDALASATDHIVAGFSEKLTGMKIHLIGGHVNTTAATTLVIKYWNGAAWTAVDWSDDGTAAGGIGFAQSGIVQWKSPPIASEHKREIAGHGKKRKKKKSFGGTTTYSMPLYYYQISFDENLSADVQIYYIAGIPAPKSLTYNHIGKFKFPVFAKERLWLGCDTDNERNKAICSMRDAPDVWNGDDTTEFFFGDESELTCGCSLYSRLGSSIYNVILFFKKNALYGLTGNSPADFVQYEISKTTGIVAPLTLKTTVLSIGGHSRPVAIGQGANGIYIFDNTSLESVSGDISDIFDKNSSTCINPTKIADSISFIDEEKMEYHWLFAQGSSTTLNKEFVLDLRKGQWFEINRGTGKALQCGFKTEDTNGNTYCYGMTNDGFMQRLENGTTFDGNNIVAVLKTADIAPHNGSIMYESQLLRHKIVNRSEIDSNMYSSTLSITHYGDSSTTGTSLQSFTTGKAGYRIMDTIDNINLGNHIFHAFEYTMSITYGEKSFEPMFIGAKFNILGEDLS